MSDCYCYYYDEQHNRCNCYINKNLNELLDENARLREVVSDGEENARLILAESRALQAENEKLREENERFIIKLNAEHIVRQNVESENAKLRELVAEIYEDQCDNSERWRYRDRMRELGIEVDG